MRNFEPQTKILNITINDKSNFISPYSETGKPVINYDVADFLENSVKAFAPQDSIILNVCSDVITSEEREEFAKAIKNYYTLKQQDVIRDIKRKTFFATIMSIIGIFALAIMFIVSRFSNEIWTECIDIFAWVFIWEAVDLFFIQKNALKISYKRYDNFIKMQINFV